MLGGKRLIAVETVPCHEHPLHLPFHPRNPDFRGLIRLPQTDLEIMRIWSCLGSMVQQLRVPGKRLGSLGQSGLCFEALKYICGSKLVTLTSGLTADSTEPKLQRLLRPRKGGIQGLPWVLPPTQQQLHNFHIIITYSP